MKYLIQNKHWNIVEDYNLEKLLYLLVDRPSYINFARDFFWLNNKEKQHRNYNLPAIEWSGGTKYWVLNGELHRKDGPAIIYASAGIVEYWSNGIKQLNK